MMLDRENGVLGAAHALDCVVVEIEVCDLDVIWEGSVVGGESVVLSGDGDLAGAEIFDRVVSAAMSKLQFEGFAAEAVSENLVA